MSRDTNQTVTFTLDGREARSAEVQLLSVAGRIAIAAGR